MYVSTAAVVVVGGWWFQKGVQKTHILGAALSASGVFFLLSNLSVFLETNLYPKTAAGLMMCYTAALPFLANTVMSDLLYSALLFGLYAWASSKMQPSAA
jgi:drug/metabolite transporter (DMT)-like permease